ncbi:S10 family peptidase [Enhygromyxa salina]|nr:S10 family peptidase [Enhygromyxa salina]
MDVVIRACALGTVLVVGACAQPSATDASVGEDSSESGTDATATGALSDLPGETETETETETGADCPPPPCAACTCENGELSCACLEPAAGFIELEGVDYVLGQGPNALALSSTDSRQFWAFQPAQDQRQPAPLFVFFNGGPGVSSGMLLGLSTGERSFDPKLTGPDAAVVDNPHSWTSFANLLWIDARQTGFSYGLLSDPSDASARAQAMDVASFNSYRDAADFVRTLLRFLAAHPSLRATEVVLVAESYGGIRAQIMLDMLLWANAYEDGTRKLSDAALVDEIQTHHLEVHASTAAADVSAQFGRQVLIQPALTGSVQQFTAGAMFEQPDSVIEQFALELGVDYPSCAEKGGPCDAYGNAISFIGNQGRSAYDYRAPASWLNDVFNLVAARLNDVDATQALLGVEITNIAGIAARDRPQGWRFVSADPYPADADLGNWPDHGGALQAWDRYFLSFNAEALGQFRSYEARLLNVDPADGHFGELFVSNLVFVDTLITDAAYDVVIYTPAIPAALESYTGLVAGVIVDPDAREWTIEYQDGVLGDPGARVVSVPSYAASHAVSYDAPGKLHADVSAWLGG